MADFTAKQGDAGPTFSDTLTYSDGTAVNLTGGTVKFVMRSRAQNAPAINATATVVSAVAGTVSYTPTAADTATAGVYAAYWLVTNLSQTPLRWPTVGYLSVEIQENLETVSQTIVELDDVKDALNIQATDHAHDAELLRFVAGLTPVVEFYTGPVLPKIIQDEIHDGGFPWVMCRHRPVISVSQVTEYLGNVRYDLQQVLTPDQATTFCYSVDGGRITRRNVGTASPFAPGVGTVWITYTAGRISIPQNIRLGTIELVRVNYQTTQQSGRTPLGALGPMDEGIESPVPGYLVPNRVKEMLQPSKRHPATC